MGVAIVLGLLVLFALAIWRLLRWAWKVELEEYNQIYEEISGYRLPDGDQARPPNPMF
jgi:hypothetical protein